nr:DNA topoisomerase 2 isoform X1 [Tanacetum cinerariifolium]
MGGKDHADGTLLFTRLSPITQYLFLKDDELLLNDLNEEDGQSLGPAWSWTLDYYEFLEVASRGGKDIKINELK